MIVHRPVTSDMLLNVCLDRVSLPFPSFNVVYRVLQLRSPALHRGKGGRVIERIMRLVVVKGPVV